MCVPSLSKHRSLVAVLVVGTVAWLAAPVGADEPKPKEPAAAFKDEPTAQCGSMIR